MDTPKRRLSSKTAESNLVAYNNLAAMPDYAPTKEEFAKETAATHFSQVLDAKRMEAEAEVKWRAQRASAIAAEWRLHNTMLGCKAQTLAQFGPDSNQAEALGLKKKSEYKKRKRKASGAPVKTA